MNDLPYWLNILGLTFDIIGVLILFKYGLPSKIEEHGGGLLLEETSKQESDRKKNNKRIIYLSYSGLILLIIGFSIQLFANIINISCK